MLFRQKNVTGTQFSHQTLKEKFVFVNYILPTLSIKVMKVTILK